jgi:phosphoglycerol transferase
MAPAHEAMRTQFAIYADFMKQIESSVPANTMIFQLPYMPFPETPAIHKMGDYDPLLGYLHSRTLRWSYGAMRGRPGDALIREIAGKPVEPMVNALLLVGFRGIYIDRFGYEDDANNLEAQLGQVLGMRPIVSSDGRLSFFSLSAADVKLRSKYTSAELQVLRDAALGIVPLSVTLEPSCWPLEGTADNNWHWCPDQGKWLVSNKSPAPKRVRLDMTVATGYNEASNLRIVSPWLTKDIRTSAIGTPLQLSLTIPPGDYTMEFKSDAKTVHVTGELRPLVFQVKNFHLATIPDQAP